MQLQFTNQIRLGFGLAVLVLLTTSLVTYFSIHQLSFYTRQVEHTYKILQSTSDLRTSVRDAQNDIHNYLILGDSSYLPAYDQAKTQLSQDYASLRLLTVDNAEQQQRMDTLRQMLDTELAHLDNARRQPVGFASAQLATGADKGMVQKIRLLVLRIKAKEEELLKKRDQRQTFFAISSPVAIAVSGVVAVLIVLWLFTRIIRQLRENERLQQELTQLNQHTASRIRSIRRLAEQVVKGDYTVKIEDAEQDNLGTLATLLNRMTQTLQDTFGALQKRNQELDQFAYVASHDLKAPMRGVSTIVKWIEEELSQELSDQMRQYLGMVKGRLTRLEDLINGLLQYARIGRIAPKQEIVDIQQLVRDVTELVVPRDFTVAVPTPLPAIVADRLRLQQVFTNVFSNAVKYHDRGAGTITVRYQELPDDHEFTIADDGPGIAPEFHDKIFLIFQTLRDRHSVESTGIGLSIVQKIIDENRGRIRVESAVGKGAAFIFTWPKAAQPALAA